MSNNRHKNQDVYRARKGKILCGVCKGIADYLGVKPIAVRLLWFLMCFCWGTGILAYIACIIMIPKEPLPKDHQELQTKDPKEPQTKRP